MQYTFDDLVVAVAPEQMATLLRDWEWLIGPARCCLVTSAGDVFFADQAGAVHMLDIEEARYELVASGAEGFNAGLRDPATAHQWLGVNRYLRWRNANLSLAPGQFFSFITPLCLGGEDAAGNVEASDPVVTVSILGQIHNRIRHLSDDAQIGDADLQ